MGERSRESTERRWEGKLRVGWLRGGIARGNSRRSRVEHKERRGRGDI